MATIRLIWNKLLGRTASHDAACEREAAACKVLKNKAITTIIHPPKRPPVARVG